MRVIKKGGIKDDIRWCKNTKPSKDWQFVAVCAGNKCSSFYIGDLQREPEFTEKVNADIGGKSTYSIGRETLGPGKFAMMKVFDYKLDNEALKHEYHCSKYEISLQWDKQQMDAVKEMLMEYVFAEEIAEEIVHYCHYRNYRNLSIQEK